jgi:hypothetical protein
MKKTFDEVLFDIFKTRKEKENIVYKDVIPLDVSVVLNNINSVFETNNIEFLIPFVYKYNTYKHIKIIIPDIYSAMQICTLLDIDTYKAHKEFIDVNINNVNITFILTPIDNFNITFYYYSWDILPTLINVILDGFGLRFDKDGLKHTTYGNYLLSTNIKDIIDFVGLDFKVYKNGFFTLENEINYIINSIYFNPDMFYNYEIDKKDYFYDEKVIMYKECLKCFEPYKDSLSNFNFDTKSSYLLLIAEYFYESGFINKITEKK